MAGSRIYIEFDADEFARDFLSEYKKYTKEKETAVRDAVKRIGKELVSDVKGKSPVQIKSRRKNNIYPPGTYKRGWRYNTLRNDGIRITVGPVNGTEQYRIAHLLELGHRIVRVSGGIKIDTGKRTRAFPHIKEPQRIANEKLDKELKKIFED